MSSSSASVSPKTYARSWASIVKGHKEMDVDAAEFVPKGLNTGAKEFVMAVVPQGPQTTPWTYAAINGAFFEDSDSDDSDDDEETKPSEFVATMSPDVAEFVPAGLNPVAKEFVPAGAPDSDDDDSDDDEEAKPSEFVATMSPDVAEFVPAGLKPVAKEFVPAGAPDQLAGAWTCEALDAAFESDSDSDSDSDTADEDVSCGKVVGRFTTMSREELDAAFDSDSDIDSDTADEDVSCGKVVGRTSRASSTTAGEDSSDSDSGFENARRSFHARFAVKSNTVRPPPGLEHLDMTRPPPGLEHLGPQHLVA